MMRRVDQVFDAIRSHLRNVEDRLECFSRYEFQAEGWLKGELVALFHGMKSRREILDFNREIATDGEGRIDLAVDLSSGRHWLELKHWLIGRQKDQTWNPKDYVWDLENEIRKFTAVRAGKRAWVAVLCTRNPGVETWSDALRDFNAENTPQALACEDDPSTYPGSYFLGIIHATGLVS